MAWSVGSCRPYSCGCPAAPPGCRSTTASYETHAAPAHLPTHTCSAFVIVSATPASPTTANVLLGPLRGGKPSSYSVRVCLDSAPTKCKSRTCTSVDCGPFTQLTPGAKYTVSANATLTSGGVVPAANNLPLAMPARTAPVLLAASPAGLTRGSALAAHPSSGACPSYRWSFTPLGGDNAATADTTSLSVTTATGSLAAGGAYQARVACLRSGVAGTPSNSLNFVMPAPGAPYNDGKAKSATTGTVAVQPPPGTGAGGRAGVCVLAAAATRL